MFSYECWRPRRAFCISLSFCTLLSFAAAAAGATPSRLDDAAAGFKSYTLNQIEESLAGARALRDGIEARDLAEAQAAWRAARGGWERSEVIAGEYFPDLDEAIDAWPNAKSGFHAIEAKLFGAHQLDVGPLVDALIARLSEFDQRLRGAVLSPQGLLNGISRLTYEVGESKANGGESQFSGYSLEDMRFNVAGIDAAYSAVFAPDLAEKDPELAALTRTEVERLKSIVAAADLKSIDQSELRKVSEDLAAIWQTVGPVLGLDPPRLED